MGEQLEEKRRRRQLRSVCAAGFVTAFGAHAGAPNLGGCASGHNAPPWQLGILLALYDGAEVVLKTVFGVLADRIGLRLGRPGDGREGTQ